MIVLIETLEVWKYHLYLLKANMMLNRLKKIMIRKYVSIGLVFTMKLTRTGQ
jgi:hypothetical protein